jgi:hypothetical protein
MRSKLSPGNPNALSRPLGMLPALGLIQAHPNELVTHRTLQGLARALHQLRGGKPWRLKGGVNDYGGYLTTPTVQVYADDPVTQDETWLAAVVVCPDRPLLGDGSRRDVALLHDALFRTLPQSEQRRLDPERAARAA